MMDTFTDRIRQLRKAAGLTQQQVASALGVGQTTVANYEKGVRVPDQQRLVQYADFFGVTVDYLLGRPAVPPIQSNEAPAEEPCYDFADYMASLLECNARQALGILRALRAQGTPLAVLYKDFLERSLGQVGAMWERGDMPVWKEHCISGITMEAMALMKDGPPSGARPLKKLLALAPGAEEHSIGLRMICDQLEAQGYQTIFLGPNVPSDGILEAIRENRAEAVLLSVTMPKHVDSLTLIIEKIKRAFGLSAPAILVGGQAFTGMRQVETITGADKYCQTYEDVVHALSRIR